MDDITPLCFQRLCFYEHFESGLGAETRHALGETKFALCSFMHRGEQRLCASEVKMPVRLAPGTRSSDSVKCGSGGFDAAKDSTDMAGERNHDESQSRHSEISHARCN